jgi:transposase
LGRQRQQSTVFALESWIGEGAISERSVYWLLAHDEGQVAKDEDYAGLYGSGGRASWPPSLMVKVLLLQLADRASDAEAEARCQFDLRWKYALGLGLQEKGPDSTTLCTFRARLLRHDAGRKALTASLRWAKERGWIKGEIEVIVDSLATVGAGAQQDTFTLIRKALRTLARSLRGHAVHGAWAEGVLAEPDRKPEVPWNDGGAKDAALTDLVAAADAALERTADAEHSPEVQQARQLLARVVGQDIEPAEEGFRIREGVAEDRICSATDPDMRHGHKTSSGRFNGYKPEVAIDQDSQLITHMDVIPGNAPDGQGLAEEIRRVEQEEGIRVTRVMGDTAYGRPQVRAALEADGRQVIAPVQAPTNRGLYTKDKFHIDLARQRCECPAGKVGRAKKDGHGVLIGFQFAAKQCATCPLRPQCTTSRHGRLVTIRADEARRQELRAQQASPGWQAEYRKRPRVEHTIAQCKGYGLGRARYRGKAKVRLQALLTAALVNVRRIGRLLHPDPRAMAPPAIA